MKKIETKSGIRILKNDNRGSDKLPEFLTEDAVSHIRKFHETVPGYRATPLVRLDGLADRLGVGRVYLKDESKRFGLNAFKALGGIYAVTKVLCQELGLDINQISFSDLQTPKIRNRIKDIAFITATDGNHGRGIAWAANQYGCKSYIYMTKGTARSRVDAVRAVGAEDVIVTDMNYDDTVQLTVRLAEENGWILTQDTGWEGFEEMSRWIIQGYTTMGAEILDQLRLDGVVKPTHLFLQAGVGSFAGGFLGYFVNRFDGTPPITTITEPVNVACVLESVLAGDGKPHAIPGIQETIMAGLNCGEPCYTVWGILRDWPSFYAACPDFVTAKGMRTLANPIGNDQRVISGESGAVSLGLLALLMEREDMAEARQMMGLDENSVVLVISTEGDTDPVGWYDVVYNGKYPVE